MESVPDPCMVSSCYRTISGVSYGERIMNSLFSVSRDCDSCFILTIQAILIIIEDNDTKKKQKAYNFVISIMTDPELSMNLELPYIDISIRSTFPTK